MRPTSRKAFSAALLALSMPAASFARAGDASRTGYIVNPSGKPYVLVSKGSSDPVTFSWLDLDAGRKVVAVYQHPFFHVIQPHSAVMLSYPKVPEAQHTAFLDFTLSAGLDDSAGTDLAESARRDDTYAFRVHSTEAGPARQPATLEVPLLGIYNRVDALNFTTILLPVE